ncbi:MAG: hydroxymethylbilane synthase, partial [Pseudomonadota bacterium]
MSAKITIGTRGSRLALAQAAQTRVALMLAHGFNDADIATEVITTSGDRIQDRSLIEAGGKGLFTKEIEEALLGGSIDVAVHSAKDMPAAIPAGLHLAACLPREDVRDCLIGKTLSDLPQGAKLGTSSPRRAALMKRVRPDLNVVDFRGNVDTRIAKIARGEAGATLLALAGLKRINMTDAIAEILSVEDFLPAVGQGAIVLETRDNDTGNHIRRTQHYVRALARQLCGHPRFAAFLSERNITMLFKSAPLHDIGKVGI